MVRRSTCALASLVLICLPALASGTLDHSRQQRIDKLFEQYDKPTSPGCSLGVISGGQMSYARGYGMASIDPPQANDSSKMFDVASNAKQFTASAIIRLVQMGKLKFTDDARKYVPELPDYGTPITLNHLLSHTSGLRDHILLLTLGGRLESEVVTKQQTLDLIFRQRKLNFTPGTRYAYSNTGYFLLSIIVERVSGKPFNTFMREQLFDPLGMPSSVFRDRHDIAIPNAAQGYMPTPTGFDVVHTNWDSAAGGGGLYTSIDEVQRWDANFYQPKVGGPELIKELHRTSALANGQPLVYARGLQVDTYRGLKRVRHGGDWTGFHSQIVRFPDQHTTVALFCNAEGIDQYSLSTSVVDIVLEDAFTKPKRPQPPPAPSLPLQRFEGQYFSGTTTREVYSARVDAGVLKLSYLTFEAPLTAIGPAKFAITGLPGGTVDFLIEGSGKAHALRIKLLGDEPDQAPILAERLAPVAPMNPSEFVGTFYSPELDVSWSLAVPAGDSKLTLMPDPKQLVLDQSGPLSPALTDAFHGKAGFLHFTRNAMGKVDGFNLSFNGPIDIRFDKR